MDRGVELGGRAFNFGRTMLSAYGVVSFGLAALGLYAVVAYFVQLRSREFGIRLALGASRASLRRDVLRSGALLALAGAAAGSAASLSAGRVLWAMVPGFGQIEASTIALVAVALVTMAAAASWLPPAPRPKLIQSLPCGTSKIETSSFSCFRFPCLLSLLRVFESSWLRFCLVVS
jgi:hypothetical protein